MMRLLWLGCLVAACQDEQNLGSTPTTATTRWAIALGSANNDWGYGVATDSIGDVVVGGVRDSPYDAEYGFGGTRGFVTKRVASDGSERWTAFVPGLDSQSIASIGAVAVDRSDAIVVVGYYVGTIDVGGTTLSGDTRGEAFVAKYLADGTPVWARRLGPTAAASANAVATDANDNIYIAGSFQDGTLDLGDGTATETMQDNDAFLLALDANGTSMWGRAFQSPNGPTAVDVGIAPTGDVLVVGTLSGGTSVGGATLGSDGDHLGYVTRFRSDGLYLASKALGPSSPGAASATHLAVSDSLVLVETGEQDGSDSTTVVHALDVNDDEVWSSHIDTSDAASPLSVAPDGTVQASSWTDGNPGANVAAAMNISMFGNAGMVGASKCCGHDVHHRCVRRRDRFRNRSARNARRWR